jgi:DNA-directed RNA polymerase subunit L
MSLPKLISVKFDRKDVFMDIDQKKLFPLNNTYVSIEIKNVSVAFINAFRRISIDELQGHSLQISTDGEWMCNDEYILPQFLNQRISLVPLKSSIGNDYNSIKFELIADNTTYELKTLYTKDLVVTSGKLTEPIFNPTFKLCTLMPGRKISIKNIYIGNGFGKYNACYQKVRCGAYKHLDIPEYDKKETHNQDGTQVDYSGYKISSMISNPQHHLYTCIIPATNKNMNEVMSIFIDVCNNAKDRLRHILYYIESHTNDQNDQDIKYTVIQLSEGTYEGIIYINNETYTIGELLKRTIFDLNPDIINVKYVILTHDDCLKFTIHYKEHVTNILVKSLKYCINLFDVLQTQLKNYKL